MSYDRHSRSIHPTKDIALAEKLLSSGVPQSKVKEIFKNRIDEDDLNYVVEESRDHDGSPIAVSPDIKRLVKEAQAPEDFLDPLYEHLMKG